MLDRAKQGGRRLAEVRQSVSNLSAGIGRALETIRPGGGLITGLEAVSRGVEKIVDIGMISIQTNMLAVSVVDDSKLARMVIVSAFRRSDRIGG